MSGDKVLRIIKDIKPEAKVLLSSGYSLHTTPNEMLDEGSSGFIQKPFNIQELSKKIRDILTNRHLSDHQ
jgi:two-component system cell cycle sensor histidine kinase/response regulator CckA